MQRQLMRLALAPAFDPEAFAHWSGAVELARLDEGTRRLLVFLYPRLLAAGGRHPWLPALQRMHMHSVLRNRMLMHLGLRLVDRLARSGVPALLLKGAALAPVYYDDAGQRPMSDFDFMVPASTPQHLVERLLTSDGPMRLRDRALHAHTYLDEHGTQFDIHWHVTPELAYAGFSRRLWERAERMRLGQATAMTLRAEDHMIHLLVHGMRVSMVAPLRWVVDAAMILRRRPAFDWRLVAATARAGAIEVPIARGLSYLVAEGIAGGHAAAALADLEAARGRRSERYLFLGQMRRPSRLYSLLRPILLFRRLSRLEGEIAAAGFARFLVCLWDLDRRRQIP
ncbi:MAG TPA: nucleotidyltransferase family protein, partial [Acetobacteraceae bacterium]|nr:nucleotidyltransferase family protein [Acetobacteraceae bacterium]